MPEEKDKKSISSGTNFMPKEIKVKVLFSENDESSQDQVVSDTVKPKVLNFNNSKKPKVKQVVVSKILFDSENEENNVKTCKPLKARPVAKIVLKNAEIRKQIKVSLDELQEISTVTEESILEQAQSIIQSFNLDDGRDQKFTEFGTDLQEKYADKVEAIFKLTTNTAVNKTKVKLGRIAELIEQVSHIDTQKKDSIFSVLKKVKGSLKQDFNIVYAEIEILADELEDKIPELLNVKNKFDEFANQLPDFLDEIEAVLLAGKFLISYSTEFLENFSLEDLEDKVNYNKLETVLAVFEKRIESIELTKLSLLQGFDQVKMFRINILNMINLIQNTVVTMIPLWHNNYLNAMRVSNEKPNKKLSVYAEFKTIHDQILTKLQGE